MVEPVILAAAVNWTGRFTFIMSPLYLALVRREQNVNRLALLIRLFILPSAASDSLRANEPRNERLLPVL